MAFKNLIGKTFGRLHVLSYLGLTHRRNSLWRCRCVCGNFRNIISPSLISGNSTSCGCRRDEVATKLFTKHGMCGSKEYSTWEGMLARCYNINHVAYPNYGGRGICVCEEWQNNFAQFLQDMGKKPSSTHSLDRVDNNGNYCKTNCRWASSRQQSNNKRNTIFVMYKGRRQSLVDWAEELCIPFKTVSRRHSQFGPNSALLFRK